MDVFVNGRQIVDEYAPFIYQGGLNGTIPETFKRQGEHIAAVLRAAHDAKAVVLEPRLDAQDAWVEHIRATAFDISQLQRECTPTYFNNDGDLSKGNRWYLGETYGPGWGAFLKILYDWRESNEFPGLQVEISK